MDAEKLKQLRAWMKKHGLDAYIVPHSDRFQSEYLPPEDERLAWLTGFTGSNGMAVVTTKQAALFTDNRYTLQVGKQVDTKLYTIFDMADKQALQYLVDTMKPGDKVGFDPWLFSMTAVARYRKTAGECDWTMVSVDENPIDLLWKERPAPMVEAAEIHDVKFAGIDRAEKIKDIVKKKSSKAERLLIAQPALVCWLLNIRGRDVAHTPLLQSLAVVDADEHVTLLTDTRKIPQAMRKALGNHMTIDGLDRLPDVLTLNKKPLQVDPNWTPYAVKVLCDEKKVELVTADDPSILARAMKNETEIKGARLAHQKDKKAFVKFRTWFAKQDFAKSKITEWDIMEKLRACRANDPDFVDESFLTIAGFAGNGAIVHYGTNKETASRLKPHSLLLLDSGGQYRCGTTDITRVFAVGTPTAQMKKHYTLVLKGLIALSLARFPLGTSGAQLDALARAPLWAEGLNYGHGTGHGVGSFLSVHEGPYTFGPASHGVLKPGMILSIEPGLYFENKYGIRLENLVVVKEDKRKGDTVPMLAFETLTKVPFEADLILWDRLTDEEIAFLKGFDTVNPASRATRRKAPRRS